MFILEILTDIFGGFNSDKKTELIEGVELANNIMLKDIYAFLLVTGFYGEENAITEFKARKDVLYKNGKLRKMFDRAGIKTRYDLAINTKSIDIDILFGEFSEMIKRYRALVIEKRFSHRLSECK